MTDLKAPLEPHDSSSVSPPAASPAPSQTTGRSNGGGNRPLSSTSSLAVPVEAIIGQHEQTSRPSRLPAFGLFHPKDSDNKKPSSNSKRRLRIQVGWLGLAVLIFALTVYGYVQALDNAQRKLKDARQEREESGSDSSDANVGQIIGSTKFIHAIFCSALVVETFLVAHVAAKIGRYLIYRSYYKQQESFMSPGTAPPPEAAEDASNRPPPSRFVQALVGSPPSLPPAPALPDYDHALRQAARQSARRQAARLGVSAGRRGREQFGSGDPEDLEVERIKRLGGLPPTYRSDEMRKSTVVLKGAKPERRSSILSMFSNSAASDGDEPATPRSPGSQTGFSGFVQRLMSVKSNHNSTGSISSRSHPNSPRTPVRASSLRESKQGEGSSAVGEKEQHSIVHIEHAEKTDHRRSDSQETGKEQLADEASTTTPAYPAEAMNIILDQISPVERPGSRASRRQGEAIV